VLGAEGLVVEVNGQLDVSALEDLLAQLPALPTLPGSPLQPTDLIGILGSDQTRSLSIGQVTANLTARRTPSGVDTVSGPDLGGGATPIGDLGPIPSFDEPGSPVAPSAGRTGGGGSAPSGSLSLPSLPASGALAAIGGGLLLSTGLRRFADAVLDPMAAGAACDLRPDGGNDG
jgi:hypothetical protein